MLRVITSIKNHQPELIQNQGGDTLVEVLVSLTILSLALATAFVSTGRSLHQGVLSSNRQEATALSQQQIEIIKSSLKTNPTMYQTNDPYGFCIITSGASAGQRVDIQADGTGSDQCMMGNNNQYAIKDTYDPSTGLFTVYTSWQGNSTSPEQLSLYYRIPVPGTYVVPAPPTSPPPPTPTPPPSSPPVIGSADILGATDDPLNPGYCTGNTISLPAINSGASFCYNAAMTSDNNTGEKGGCNTTGSTNASNLWNDFSNDWALANSGPPYGGTYFGAAGTLGTGPLPTGTYTFVLTCWTPPEYLQPDGTYGSITKTASVTVTVS